MEQATETPKGKGEQVGGPLGQVHAVMKDTIEVVGPVNNVNVPAVNCEAPCCARVWVIQVGGDYGSFLFEGTEDEAEECRRAKARREGVIALKRPATEDEVKTGKTSYCWNHENFKHHSKGIHYHCECGLCP